jgi:hypothetical protein
MKIKFITSHNAAVMMNREELAECGVNAADISFDASSERKLMTMIFEALEVFCGLSRDGKFTLVECRPYLNGGCRCAIQFIDEPSPRLYIFDSADDMLDAINNLNYNEYFSTSHMDIQQVENKFFMYIPQTQNLSAHNLAILSEYACE